VAKRAMAATGDCRGEEGAERDELFMYARRPMFIYAGTGCLFVYCLPSLNGTSIPDSGGPPFTETPRAQK
jgi:hypothetical protein